MGERSDNVQHLVSIASSFSTAMLVTRTPEGDLRARPMAVAKVDATGDVYLATSLASPKIDELLHDEHATVVFQGSTKYASIGGRARIEKDRALVDQLWSESWKVWFPEGKSDPNLCILHIDANAGEFWDTSGTTGVKMLFEVAKAFVKGEKPKSDPDANAKVGL
jgi:general stress protein 26